MNHDPSFHCDPSVLCKHSGAHILLQSFRWIADHFFRCVYKDLGHINEVLQAGISNRLNTISAESEVHKLNFVNPR